MTYEHPVRTPPPLLRPGTLAEPFVECGERTRLGGVLVECVRRAGHPVRINFGHSNGYDEWCFDTPQTNNQK